VTSDSGFYGVKGIRIDPRHFFHTAVPFHPLGTLVAYLPDEILLTLNIYSGKVSALHLISEMPSLLAVELYQEPVLKMQHHFFPC
jgi:hypothetical protein